jgi:hypothetical protein
MLETIVFILNRAPSKYVETTPYELWYGKKPTLSFLKIWGCEAYVKKLQPDKLESKSEKCIFVGYPRETNGYTFYHPAKGKPFVAKAGTFLEKEFLTKGVSGRKLELNEIIDPSLEIPSSVMEAVPNAPSIEEEEGRLIKIMENSLSKLNVGLHDSANPLSGLGIMYYLSY